MLSGAERGVRAVGSIIFGKLVGTTGFEPATPTPPV